MAKLIKYQKKNNQILSVLIELTTDEERRIYRSFMDSEISLNKCEHCGESINKDDIDRYYIVIHSPASGSPLGFPTGDPMVKCPHCGKTIKMSMMDISPFKAIVKWKNEFAQAAKKKGSK